MAESDWQDVSSSSKGDWVDIAPPKRSIFSTGSPSVMEKEISQRPSMIKEMIKDPTTFQRFLQHPAGTTLRTALGAGEYLSGIPSDIMLALQRGKPQDIPSDIGKTITGQRPAQVSDVLQASGLPGVSTPAMAVPMGMGIEALKGTPTAGLGDIVGVATHPVSHALAEAVSKYGKPAIANVIRFATAGVPQKHIEDALDHPQWLNPKWLEEEGNAVKKQYKAIIEPLEENRNVKVDISPTIDKLKQFSLVTAGGEMKAELAKLTTKEQTKIMDWLTEIKGYTGGNKPTFNRVRYLLSDMDDKLSPMYKKMNKGIEPVTDTFQNITKLLRGSVRESLVFPDHPEIDQTLKRYAQWNKAKAVKDSFKGINISFYKSLPLRLALISLGIPTHGASLATLPLTMPVAYGSRFGLIRGGVGGAEAIHRTFTEPTIIMDLIKNLGLEKGAEEGQYSK